MHYLPAPLQGLLHGPPPAPLSASVPAPLLMNYLKMREQVKDQKIIVMNYLPACLLYPNPAPSALQQAPLPAPFPAPFPAPLPTPLLAPLLAPLPALNPIFFEV